MDNRMVDQEKDAGQKLLTNGNNQSNVKQNNLLAEQDYSRGEINKFKRYFYGLCAIVVAAFVILIVTFTVCFANLKYEIGHHNHPPKIGAQINKILDKEELCLACDEVRLGPSLEEDQMLDYFVRKHETGIKGEQCCVETSQQLLRLLQLFVERTYREAMAQGNIKIASNSDPDTTDLKPAAHLMGSVRRPEQPTVPGRQFPISHWINDEDLAFTNKVQYRHGRIVILEAGLYYVYSQLSFLEVFDGVANAETGSQSLSHYLYRYNIVYPHGGEESMIQNSITKCWGQNKAFGEYTSYLGAVFHLRQGDELFVKVSNLTLIVREPKLNYFGLFKIN